jgi:AraC-like DNA-binding protein
MPERFGKVVGDRLSPRQQLRAYDFIDARLDGELSVAEIARHCSLSPSRFNVAFRNTTGVTPHRWLTERRVDRAKSLLRGGSASLAQIALACGFADQSHFTHVFSAAVGASPGEWRRAATA